MEEKNDGTLSGSIPRTKSPRERVSLTRRSDGVVFGVRVAPSASRTAFLGFYGDRLKVSVSAPPEKNKANQALLEALSEWLNLPKGAFSVVGGHGTRDKIILVSGVEEHMLRSRLEALQDLQPAAGE